MTCVRTEPGFRSGSAATISPGRKVHPPRPRQIRRAASRTRSRIDMGSIYTCIWRCATRLILERRFVVRGGDEETLGQSLRQSQEERREEPDPERRRGGGEDGEGLGGAERRRALLAGRVADVHL